MIHCMPTSSPHVRMRFTQMPISNLMLKVSKLLHLLQAVTVSVRLIAMKGMKAMKVAMKVLKIRKIAVAMKSMKSMKAVKSMKVMKKLRRMPMARLAAGMGAATLKPNLRAIERELSLSRGRPLKPWEKAKCKQILALRQMKLKDRFELDLDQANQDYLDMCGYNRSFNCPPACSWKRHVPCSVLAIEGFSIYNGE